VIAIHGNRPPERWTLLRPDGGAVHLERKLVAHYHADPLGATTVVDQSLRFEIRGIAIAA
jgi:hypothetical protein